MGCRDGRHLVCHRPGGHNLLRPTRPLRPVGPGGPARRGLSVLPDSRAHHRRQAAQQPARLATTTRRRHPRPERTPALLRRLHPLLPAGQPPRRARRGLGVHLDLGAHLPDPAIGVPAVSHWPVAISALASAGLGGWPNRRSGAAGGSLSGRPAGVLPDHPNPVGIPDLTPGVFATLTRVYFVLLLLSATLAERLGLERAADELVDLGDQPGAAHPGAKVLTLVHSLVAGGDCIDDVEMLRAGATSSVLGHRVLAASTVGTFLRSFTFGHVRQLDRLAEIALSRAWAAGAGPGDGELMVDADSTICEVHGHHKQGATYGYTGKPGYHPLLATRADTGEILHARQRTGKANTARGASRFVDETVGR